MSEKTTNSLLLVSGMSGAGKTQAMRALEDMGYFCIDNYPFSMIEELLDNVLLKHQALFPLIAIAIDVRGREFLEDIDKRIASLDGQPIDFSILFVDAREDVLMNRYKESRRRHPLQDKKPLLLAIREERVILSGLRAHANRVLDTSDLSVKDYKSLLYNLYGHQEPKMMITVASFGFKFGLPLDADLVFDVRFLPNPFYDPILKLLTGKDEPVRQDVLGREETGIFLKYLSDMLYFLLPQYIKEGKKQLVIAIGCTGGQHRSVVIGEKLAEILCRPEVDIVCQHRELKRYVKLNCSK